MKIECAVTREIMLGFCHFLCCREEKEKEMMKKEREKRPRIADQFADVKDELGTCCGNYGTYNNVRSRDLMLGCMQLRSLKLNGKLFLRQEIIA